MTEDPLTDTRRQVLEALAAGPVTGPALAERLECSRTAVWKHVEALRQAGFEIAAGGDGYELVGIPDYGAASIAHGLSAPYTIHYRETVASTNDVARSLAEQGERNVVVVADEQTGGRGRKDRTWQSPPGGIWASVVVEPDLSPARVPLVTLAAAVAVVEAVSSVGVETTIKWPNDVLAAPPPGGNSPATTAPTPDQDTEPRKLAGILTEMTGASATVSWVVVGIGLNATVDPADLGPGATSLGELVGDVDRRAVLQELLEQFHALVSEPDEIRPAWLEHASTLGRDVRVDLGAETITGRAVDVTEVGALVVETSEGRRTVHAGDCEHVRPV